MGCMEGSSNSKQGLEFELRIWRYRVRVQEEKLTTKYQDLDKGSMEASDASTN